MEDLVAITPAREVMIDDFQTLDNWHAVEDFSRPGLYAFEASTSMARNNGGTAAAFSWSPGGVSGVRGINAGSPVSPMPALVNQKFLDIADARIGDTLTVGMSAVTLPIRPVAVADYFPTLYPREEPFAVVDLKTYNHFRNMHDQRAVGGSNELWVSLNGSNGASSARDITNALESRGIRVRDVQQAAAMVADRVEQPLVNAGWGGLFGVDVPDTGAGQRLRGNAVLLHGYARETDGVCPTAHHGFCQVATQWRCMVQPFRGGSLWNRHWDMGGTSNRHRVFHWRAIKYSLASCPSLNMPRKASA